MYSVYAILSCNRKYVYVGLSANLKDRLSRHNAGREKTTKPYAPFIILYFEVGFDRQQARKREIYLKSRNGKRFLYKLIEKHKFVLNRAGLSNWR